MLTRPCPACGAPTPFRSSAPYAVCAYCRSLLIRRDARLETIGRVAEVPDDFSPLQLGVTGTFDEHSFTLVGRIRKAWDQGSWSEWCAMFDERRHGWLAEAQGDLVMTFERPAESLSPRSTAASLRQVSPGTQFDIDGHTYTVSDVKAVTLVGAEGELMSCPTEDSAMTSIDLRGGDLEFATLEVSDDALSVFTGRLVDFGESRFRGLRQLDGWRPAGPGTP